MRRDIEVAEVRGITLPAHRVAARPVAIGLRADAERHRQAVARVEAGATHLRKVPALAQVAGAPFAVGLEATAGQHHRMGRDALHAPTDAGHHTGDPLDVVYQFPDPGVVADPHALLLGGPVERLDQAGPSPVGRQRRAAPELEAAVGLVGLAAVVGLELHAVGVHPAHHRVAVAHQDFAQVGVGAVQGDARHVVEEICFGVRAEIGVRNFIGGEVTGQGNDVVHTVVGEAHLAVGVGGVATAFGHRCALQQQHAGALFARGYGGTQRGVAAAHDHHIGLGLVIVHGFGLTINTVLLRVSGNRQLIRRGCWRGR